MKEAFAMLRTSVLFYDTSCAAARAVLDMGKVICDCQ